KGGDIQGRASEREEVGKSDVRERNVDETVEHRVIGNVARIETKLDQHLFDPKILCRKLEGAVEDRGQIEVSAAHLFLNETAGRRPAGEMGAFPATGGALTLGEMTHSR